MDHLKELYTEYKTQQPVNIEKLPGAGSNRKYYRFTDQDGTTLIGVLGTSCDENHAFITMARHFTKLGLPVPEVLAVSDDEMRYLISDLGDRSLFDAIQTGRKLGGDYNEYERELLKKVIRLLPEIQLHGAEGMDWSVCYPQPSFDKENVFFDLNYFKYCFLKATSVDFHEVKLEADFKRLADDLTNSSNSFAFMYRDFQARNIMLDREDNPYFIDFQGGRKGPYYYDVASFLWQASAKYPEELRNELICEYYNVLKTHTDVPSEKEFCECLQTFVLFRILQVLGAYGFRGFFERKKHFIDSIPPAIENLRYLLAHNAYPYTYLVEILQQLVLLPQFKEKKTESKGPLVVRVFSFSYKKGIPEDESGNGGGYVFDCRSTHNPGRYEQYKKLTGLDEPVIQFLEDNGEILTFLDSVYKLADAHIERYMQRGFTSLMFSFGCTGGQHRSVYSAQHLAEHIHNKYGIEVRLCHREQGITQIL